MDQSDVFNGLKLFNKTPKGQPMILRKVSIKQVFMLFSVSIFSLALSSSNFVPSFLKPLNSYISTFPLRLLTHGIDKSCIFLICNAILVFLAKSSGTNHLKATAKHIELLSLDNMKDEPTAFMSTDEHLAPAGRLKKVSDNSVTENKDRYYSFQEANEENGIEEANDGPSKVSTAEQQGHENFADLRDQEEYGLDDDEVKDDRYSHNDDDGVPENHVEELDDDIFGTMEANLSTDELNKKFEEFIRRMKQEIKIEDQQQLAVV